MSRTAASIIIPTFNRARLVGTAIDSAIAQGDDHEILVVDDGSTDETVAVLAHYGDRIRVARQANRGVSASRNRGVALATRPWIQFLDSDDRLADGAVSASMAIADTLAPRTIALGEIEFVDAHGAPLPGAPAPLPTGPLPLNRMLDRFIGSPQPLFPAEALRAVGGFEAQYRNHEDHELVVRLWAAGYSFVATGITVCVAQGHAGDRLSADRSTARFQQRADVLQAITEQLEAGKADRDARRVHGRLVWSVAREAAQTGHAADARRLFALARSIAGADAINAREPVRTAQRLFDPYRVERFVEVLKRMRGASRSS